MVAVLHATRFAQTGVPDDATMPSFEPFGQRAPQMGGCHIQRVPVSSGLSQVWSGFGICDAVEVLPRISNGKSCFDFFFLYGPGGPGLKTLFFSANGDLTGPCPFLLVPSRRSGRKKKRPPRSAFASKSSPLRGA